MSEKDMSCCVCTTSTTPREDLRSADVNSGSTTVEWTRHCCASLARKYTSLLYFCTLRDISGCAHQLTPFNLAPFS